MQARYYIWRLYRNPYHGPTWTLVRANGGRTVSWTRNAALRRAERLIGERAVVVPVTCAVAPDKPDFDWPAALTVAL